MEILEKSSRYKAEVRKIKVQSKKIGYLTKHNRRSLVRPKWLVRNILELTKKKQLLVSDEDRSRLLKRRLNECLEMLTPRTVGEGEK